MNGGRCTLRAALMEANYNSFGTTHIAFNINDPGCTNDICVIQIDQTNLGHLPDIVERVTIDGSTQPNNSDVCDSPILGRFDYKVVIQGQSTDIGLRLEEGSDGSVIRGLNIRNFFNNIAIINSDANRIECNYIGTDETGLLGTGMNPANGIVVGCESEDNTIGGPMLSDGNVISGHAFDGIQFYAGFVCPTPTSLPSNTAILGNYIGVAKDGVTPLGNGFSGISFFAGATFEHYIGTLQDGSSMNPNVIGSNASGVFIGDGSNNISIKGNYIGTDTSGQVNLGHMYSGIEIAAGSDNVIGGEFAAEGNVLANNDAGVLVTDDSATGNVVRKNDFINNIGLEFELIRDGSFNADGLNPNDADDVDTGANQLMNHPVITATSFIDLSGALYTEVEFSVDAAQANVSYPIEIDAYFNDEPGEVKKAVFIDSQTYVFPQLSTTAVFDIPDGITGGEIRLVATDANGNSSELSPPFIVGFVDLIFKDGFE
jgi:hypothetical protein